jgi:hypothetical protein
MVTIKRKSENKDDSLRQATLMFEKRFDLQDFTATLIEAEPSTIKELVEDYLHTEGFPKGVTYIDVDWHLKPRLRASYDKWVELGINEGYIAEDDLRDGLREFFDTGRSMQMALKEWQKSHLLDLEVVLNETLEKWERRMGGSEELLDNFYSLFDAIQVNKLLTENIDSYPELVEEFRDKTKEAGLDNAKLNNTHYKVKVNTQGNESEIVLLMTLILNINRPQALDSIPKMTADDFNTLLCLPSIFRKLSKTVELLDSVNEWEERNKQIASDRVAIQKISQKLAESFNPDEILQHLVATPSPDNPYYKKLEALAEERHVSVEKLLTQKPKATLKFNGDMADLSKKLLDTKLSEYEKYNKFILGEKEIVNALWLEEPLVKSINVEFIG